MKIINLDSLHLQRDTNGKYYLCEVIYSNPCAARFNKICEINKSSITNSLLPGRFMKFSYIFCSKEKEK